VKLRGLEPGARYVVHDVDEAESREATGHELMEDGLRLQAVERSAAVVVRYARQPRG
jgi:hypothetical protein